MDKHVLLIDDDLDMHDIIKLVLEPLGCRVTCCSSGPAGMDLLRREPPDLLLLDIMLSSPTEGLVLAKKIKGDETLKTIPIILISSIGESVGADYARELGDSVVPGEGFMEKPLDPPRLREAVTQILTGRS